MAVELRKIDTEQRNPRTMHIDTLSTLEMVKLINDEDHRVGDAVGVPQDQVHAEPDHQRSQRDKDRHHDPPFRWKV